MSDELTIEIGEDLDPQVLEDADYFPFEEEKHVLLNWLQEEIEDIRDGSERAGLKYQWEKWRRLSEVKPEQEQKTYPWSGACFPEDVEILTEVGWKPVAEVKVGEKVASREPGTGVLTYEPVTETLEFDAPEDMIRISNLYIDITTTPNHRFLLEERYSKRTKEVTAEEAATSFEGRTNYRLPMTAYWDTEEADGLFGFPAEQFLEFLGWFISEGWVYKNRTIGISQSATANPENVTSIRKLLDSMGLSYSYVRNSTFLVNVTSAQADYLRSLGRSWEKHIPREILDLPAHQLKYLLDTLIAGDGCVSWAKDKHRNFPSMSYYTTSKELADDVQELALKVGHSALVTKTDPKNGGKIRGRWITGARASYAVGFRFVETTTFRNDRCSFEWVKPTSEKVYCVTVPPHHTIYVRQHGRPVWTMNSNMVTPFLFSQINGVNSHVKSALTEKKPRADVECMDGNYIDNAKAVKHFVNKLAESPIHMNLPAYDHEICWDNGRMGTVVVEVPWVTRERQFKRMKQGRPEVVNSVEYQGPGIVVHRLEDVFIRSHWDDVQKAPYIGFRYHFTEQALDQLGRQGFFNNVDKVMGRIDEEVEESREREHEDIGIDEHNAADLSRQYQIYKVYVRFNADRDHIDEDFVMWIDLETQTILRVEYNELGRRPIAVLRHIKVPQLFWGMGVGWILSPTQEEIDSLHNMRIDSIHVSSLQMFATRKGSGLGAEEEFFPLKNIQVDDPSSDIQIFKFPDSSASTLQSEQFSQSYGRSATGISEVQLGMPDTTAKSGTAPTLQQFLAQQGNKVLRDIISNAEAAYGEIFLYSFLQCVANSDIVLADERMMALVSEDERELLADVLSMEVEDVHNRFVFDVRATEVEETEDAKRQMILTKTQLYTQYIQQAMGLRQMMENPQMPEGLRKFVSELYLGLTDLMRETLSLYNVDNPDKLLPATKALELMIEMLDVQQQPQIKQMQELLRRVNGNEGANEAGVESYGADPGRADNAGRPMSGGGVSSPDAVPEGAQGPTSQPTAGSVGAGQGGQAGGGASQPV